MFTTERRDQVRERLLELAADDPDVVAAAITGSCAVGASDEWSDVDIAFGIRGELGPALERWTRRFYDELGALHHWDLPWGSTIYRVFLLPETLQVDVAFIPEADFGPGGPNWQTVFGETVEPPKRPPIVRSLDEAELRRALAAAVGALAQELERTDADLAARLRPTIDEVRARSGGRRASA